MKNKPLIYVIDDEADICQLLVQTLQQYDFVSESFSTGSQALQALKRKLPALCIIDLGLPDMDGLSLVKQVCADNHIGVIILSGRSSLPDKVLGLELGADDYISKPFDARELVARVNSIIRRMRVNGAAAQPKIAKFADWSFDLATLMLTQHTGSKIMLSAAEAEILTLLLASPQQILTRERLLSDDAAVYDRSIDVRMSRLRKKLEIDHKNPRIIKTVYGVGYMFTSAVTWQ